MDAKMDQMLALLHQLTSAAMSQQTASGQGCGSDEAPSACQP